MTASNAVTTSLIYSLRPSDGARAFVTINVNPETGERGTNVEKVAHDVKVEDVRGKEHLYTLDSGGFQFCTHPTNCSDLRDNKRIEEEYYPECVEFIKKLTGAPRVVVFDHTRRLHNPDDIDSSPDRRQPVTAVHVDQTDTSAAARVRRHMPAEDASALLRRRFQIINLWRPIGNPALDFPLAICDYRSVDTKQDTFPMALVYPEHEGETMSVGYNPKHDWKYLRGMKPDECVVFKCYDSLQDGSVALFTPHTAFKDPTTPADAPRRESIELRAMVFFD